MNFMQQRNIGLFVECYVKKDGKYLMLHRNMDKRIMPGVWMAPGGKREFNEGLFECARREIKEETGLDIKNLRIIITGSSYLKDIEQEMSFHWIEADYAGGEVIQKPTDGTLEWLLPEEIFKLDDLLAEAKVVLPLVLGKNMPVMSYKSSFIEGNTMEWIKIEESN